MVLTPIYYTHSWLTARCVGSQHPRTISRQHRSYASSLFRSSGARESRPFLVWCVIVQCMFASVHVSIRSIKPVVKDRQVDVLAVSLRSAEIIFSFAGFGGASSAV